MAKLVDNGSEMPIKYPFGKYWKRAGEGLFFGDSRQNGAYLGAIDPILKGRWPNWEKSETTIGRHAALAHLQEECNQSPGGIHGNEVEASASV